MVVSEVVISDRWAGDSSETMGWLAGLLRSEGVDLMAATTTELQRGTPVYVEGSADLNDVQRRMAQNHIRMLPVLDESGFIGVIDLVELALRDDLG